MDLVVWIKHVWFDLIWFDSWRHLANDIKTPLTYRVSPKTGPVWVLITQRWLVVERRVICQKFQNAVKNRPKRQICIVKHWCAMSVRRRFMLLAVTNIYAALCNVFETFWRLTTLIFDLLSCNLAHRLLLPWEMLYKFSVLLFVLKLWPGTDRRIGGRTGKTRNAVH